MNSRVPYKAIVVTFGLAAIILSLAMFDPGCSGQADRSSSGQPSSGQLSIAHQMEAGGLMSEKDFLRLDDMDARIERGQSVSPAETSWAVNLLEAKPIVDNAFNRHARITELLGRVSYLPVKSLTYSERGIFLRTLISRLSDPIAEYRYSSVILLEHLNDTRAIPYLRALRKDPAANVSAEAARAIQMLLNNPAQSSGK